MGFHLKLFALPPAGVHLAGVQPKVLALPRVGVHLKLLALPPAKVHLKLPALPTAGAHHLEPLALPEVASEHAEFLEGS